MIHLLPKCHTSRWSTWWGLLHWNFVGGAIEPFSTRISDNKIKPFWVMCKVLFSSILSPHKTASCFIVINGLTTATLFNKYLEAPQYNIMKVFAFLHKWDWSGQPARRSISRYKTCHFLLPVGGTMTDFTHYILFDGETSKFMTGAGALDKDEKLCSSDWRHILPLSRLEGK